MKYIIYKITNTINNKFYIGKHQTNDINDSYMGSGIAITKAIKKHGKENFIKEILFVFDNEQDMNRKEKELITEELVSDPNCYNIGVGGEGGPHFKGKHHTKESMIKMIETRKKKGHLKHSEETKRKFSEIRLGRTPWNKGLKLKSLSEETKRKISDTLKRNKRNYKHSDETKLKIKLKALEREKIKRERKNEINILISTGL